MLIILIWGWERDRQIPGDLWPVPLEHSAGSKPVKDLLLQKECEHFLKNQSWGGPLGSASTFMYVHVRPTPSSKTRVKDLVSPSVLCASLVWFNFHSSAWCLFRAIILWRMIWQSLLKSCSLVNDSLTNPHHPTEDNELSLEAWDYHCWVVTE